MRFERINGGGKAIGEDVLVTNSVFDKPSYAAGLADVWNTEARTARVIGDSKVRASLLEFSSIGCERLPSEVIQSRFVHSSMKGGTCIGALVANSKIMGLPQIRGDMSKGGVKILGSVIKDRAIVEGTAIVKNVTLRDYMRIRNGVWLREPRYIQFTEAEIAEVGVTEAENQSAMIGCTVKPIRSWLKGKYRWGKAVGWTKEMCDRLALTLEEWADSPLPTN